MRERNGNQGTFAGWNRIASADGKALTTVVLTALWTLVASIHSPASARTILVPDSSATIQGALDAAVDGDEIVVAPGIYTEFIQFRGRDVVLRSTDPENPTVMGTTIINPDQSGPVVTFTGVETSTCVLSGFTLSNVEREGNPRIQGKGAGATITRCRIFNDDPTHDAGPGIVGLRGQIVGNVVSHNEGGLLDCGDVIEGNLISKNLGSALNRCRGSIRNNTIRNNSTQYGAGALDCEGELVGNFFVKNFTGNNGSAIYHFTGDVTNNTFYRNKSHEYGTTVVHVTGTIRNCIFWGNEWFPRPSGDDVYGVPVQGCLINEPERHGPTNFFADPKFRDPGTGDVRLLPNSPCIDAGVSVSNPGNDYQGLPRPVDIFTVNRNGSNMDIGADEYRGPAPLSYWPPDRPDNLLPYNGQTGTRRQPILTASGFDHSRDAPGPTGFEWQVAANSEFDPLIWAIDDSNGSHDTHQIPAGILDEMTVYYWRTRYRNCFHLWSEWSEPTSFQTRPIGTFNVPRDTPTIQEAIDEAVDGEEVVVSPGRYVENLKIADKNIVLRSTDPTNPSVVRATVIEGKSGSAILELASDVTEETLISGLTFSHLHWTGLIAGIYGRHSTATIENNYITDISGTVVLGLYQDAYPVGIASCDGVIRNNVIGDIRLYTISPFPVDPGGAVGLAGCRGTIANNLVYSPPDDDSMDTAFSGCGELVNNLFWTTDLACDTPGCPRFVDPANGDFRLLPDSPLIDAGFATDAAPLDNQGRSRPYVAIPTGGHGDGSGYDIGVSEYRPYPPEELFRFSFLRAVYAEPSQDANGDGILDVADLIFTRAQAAPLRSALPDSEKCESSL